MTLGCIDVAVAAGDEQGDGDSVVAYSLGNRCDHRVIIDLGSARVVARNFSGHEVSLTAYDPRRELGPLPLNALWSGRAQVAYRGGGAAIASLCVDVGRVDRSIGATERWICIAQDRP